MKLHSGTLYWQDQMSQRSHFPSVSEPLNCDVLIVGGGMGGAITTHMLAKTGLHVALVEKHTIGSGSSSANTGLLQYCSDKTLTSCINTFGKEKALRFYELCRNATADWIQLGQQLGAQTEMVPRSSLYFASSEHDVKMLHEEYTTLQENQFPVEWWDEERIRSQFPFSKAAALYTGGDAEVNPYGLIHSLIRSATNGGVHVFENSPITGFEYHEDHVVCRSGQHLIRAGQVVVATGYETQSMKRDPNAYLTQSFAVVTEPAPFLHDWYEQCLIWETARPYLYLRTTGDGRIIVGGCDEAIGPEGLSEARHLRQQEVLMEELRALFPQAAHLKAKYAWGAVFGQSHDGLPFIGQHPNHPRCWFLEGYGGNGTVYSLIAARILLDVLTGRHNEDLELFSLDRSTKPSPST